MNFPPFVAFSAYINGIKLFMTFGPGDILEFSPTAKVPSLLARFVVECVGHDHNLVHIRSCYNNKYLRRGSLYYIPPEAYNSYIFASANKRLQDPASVFSTMFRVNDMGSKGMSFTHVQSGYQLAFDPNNSPPCIKLAKQPILLKVIGFTELLSLPKRVIFKGDNGLYLRSCLKAPPSSLLKRGRPEQPWHVYNEFTSKNGSELSTHYEITQYNGTIGIKSVKFGKFLRRNRDLHYNSWIWGDSDDTTTNNMDTLFKVENLGNNVIALRNLGNNKMCRRLSDNGFKNCLKATETYAISKACLIVEEPPVRSRILQANYKLDDAIITSREIRSCFPVTAVNRSEDRYDELQYSFKFTETRSTSWSTNYTFTNTRSDEISVKLPKFIEGKVQVSNNFVKGEQLENGSTFSEEKSAVFKIDVPPKHKAILQGLVYEVGYDIPFSYVETIEYPTGETITVVDDGVCQGLEVYAVDFDKKYIPL